MFGQFCQHLFKYVLLCSIEPATGCPCMAATVKRFCNLVDINRAFGT